jgi:transcriptional regulator with AAA-type ATPase domain
MATVFSENIHTLSTELQEILFDDLVTALENRLKVLNKVQSNVKLEIAESDTYATIQT